MDDMKSRMAQRFDAIRNLEEKRNEDNAKIVDALIAIIMDRELQSIAVEEALLQMDAAVKAVCNMKTNA